MSAYRSVKEQATESQWFLVKLGQTVTNQQELKDPGNLYADIPRKYLLDALRHDLALSVERAKERGASVKRARSRWVDIAAKLLAERFNEHRPQSQFASDRHVTRWDGFTDLWRRHLWTALKTELYGGTGYGWALMQRMISLAIETERDGLEKPTAYAWVQVREEMEALRRDYATGIAGEVIVA